MSQRIWSGMWVNRALGGLTIGMLLMTLAGTNSWAETFSGGLGRAATAVGHTDLVNEADFADIPPVAFSFLKVGGKMNLTSSHARLWYVFQSADQEPEKKPLFLFFNGGPGSSTSAGLFSYNTARMTVDSRINGGLKVGPNPWSWTRLGNLLYVDARETGFSYNLMDDPSRYALREKEFMAQNCNAFIDAADYVRLLLRFLANHPTIQKNPVVMVGESYGGTRATVILHMLLNYRDYGNGTEVYQDKALVQEIQTHYNKVFPEYSGKRVPPDIIAAQFGHQILIEPDVSGHYQDLVAGQMYEKDDSVIYRIGRETGATYEPCNGREGCDPMMNALLFVDVQGRRDVYFYNRSVNYINRKEEEAMTRLLDPVALSTMTGTDVSSALEMYATQRDQAYRVVDTAYASEMAQSLAKASEGRLAETMVGNLNVSARTRFRMVTQSERTARIEQFKVSNPWLSWFGSLQPWDRYFIADNMMVLHGFSDNQALRKGYDVDSDGVAFGKRFLKNVLYVKTFITNAALDLIIYPEALAPALALHADVLDSARHLTHPQGSEVRPGRIVLQYKGNAFKEFPEAQKRVIRFPFYARSGHSVAILQPIELFNDVSDWLE